MKKKSLGLLLSVATLFCAAAWAGSATGPHTRLPFPQEQQARKARAATKTNNTMIYKGGPVMTAPKDLYVIYYGSFTAAQHNILDAFLENIGGSNAFNVNTKYYDASGNYIQNVVNYTPTSDAYDDSYSQGKKLGSGFDTTIIGNAINAGHFPADPNGIYILTISTDVTVPKGSWCAYHWHSTTMVPGMDIKYAVAPDPPPSMYSGCSGNVANYSETTSPNGDIGMDALTDDLIHELGETVTDPDGNAWLTKGGAEMGDLCNFVYGSTELAPNGSHANHAPNFSPIGTSFYLAQELWDRVANACSKGP